MTDPAREPHERDAPKACVIVPGNHDGVHLGHRALLRSARDFAEPRGMQTCALTFDPHPFAVLDSARKKPVLTMQPRRAQLLMRAGADRVIVQQFTPEFAALSPEAFVDSLRERGARAIVVGPDFRFGRMRAGDVALLQRLGEVHGFSVIVEAPVLLDGERVSSSAVRAALSGGDVLRACKLLGRLHEVSGLVVQGDRRGRSIGYPTANIDAEPVLPPADGVYAVMVRELGTSERRLYGGVANLGTRPTFDAGRSVEVHIFDFDRDIYGVELRLGFVGRVRGEQRFSGVDELRRQIAHDCERAREMLRGVAPEWLECL